MDVDEFSNVAAPYGPSDSATSHYFDVHIKRAKAPIFLGDAGRVKGKALYAGRELRKAERVWTEAPFVAMQHESNRREGVTCCQFCFLPLLADHGVAWRDLLHRFQAAEDTAEDDSGQLQDDSLDDALARLHMSPRSCGLVGAQAVCVCGEAYCSRECQVRAYHESHALLCCRGDPGSAMGAYLQHTQHTNDIFLLVAKVIARVLSRYLVLRNVTKAREPVDMFYKKPWWEVVLVDPEGHQDGEPRPAATMDKVAPAGTRLQRSTSDATSPDDVNDVAMDSEVASVAATSTAASVSSEDRQVASAPTQYLQEVLSFTHQLLLDALESNLVRLERENQLCGVRVDEIWRACASVLSFEFFAAQIGMFEMNNISMEIDHPFHALIDIFDPEIPSDVGPDHPVLSAEDQALVARVRRALRWEEDQRRQDAASSGSSKSEGGFPGVEGTALFPIMCTMNHSCDPNCTVLYTRDGEGHVVAIRDIQQGEELCICYIDIDMSLDARERNLREYKFTCHCLRCSREREQLVSGTDDSQAPQPMTQT